MRKGKQRWLRARGIVIFSDIILPAVQLMRGCMCVLCMDPAAINPDLWDEASNVPIVFKQGLEDLRKAVKKGMDELRNMSKDCNTEIQNEIKFAEKGG